MKNLKDLGTPEAMERFNRSLEAMDDETFFATLGIDLEQLKASACPSMDIRYTEHAWEQDGFSCDYLPEQLPSCA